MSIQLQKDKPASPETSPPPSGGAVASIVGRQVLVALRFLLAMAVVLGSAYPGVVLGLGRLRSPVTGVDPAAVPADAVTASASGLDPDISRSTRCCRSTGSPRLAGCRCRR